MQRVAFSGDGQLIASGSWDGTVKVWEARSGRCLDTFSGRDIIESLTFSANTTLLAVKAGVGIRIWNIRSHTLISSIAPRGWRIRSQFSPDHSQLVSLTSASQPYSPTVTRYLELWEIATGDLLASIQLNSDDFDNVAFGVDGSSVISDSKNTQTQGRWTISPRNRDLSTDNNHNNDHSPLPMMFVPVHNTQQPTSIHVPSPQVYYDDMDEWILDNQKRRVCWLRPDLRSRQHKFHGGKVAIGYLNESVVIVDISDVRH